MKKPILIVLGLIAALVMWSGCGGGNEASTEDAMAAEVENAAAASESDMDKAKAEAEKMAKEADAKAKEMAEKAEAEAKKAADALNK